VENLHVKVDLTQTFKRFFSDELNECYKERDARKIDYLENKLMEEKEQVNNILNQLSEIQNWRQKSALLVV